MRSASAVVQSSGTNLMGALEDVAPHLNDNGRQTVVKAAIMVAMADGVVGEEERTLIQGIATAVGMSGEELQSTLAHVVSAAQGAPGPQPEA